MLLRGAPCLLLLERAMPCADGAQMRAASAYAMMLLPDYARVLRCFMMRLPLRPPLRATTCLRACHDDLMPDVIFHADAAYVYARRGALMRYDAHERAPLMPAGMMLIARCRHFRYVAAAAEFAAPPA